MNKKIKVFGVGLNKTGTTTLGAALTTLGYSNHSGSNLDLLPLVKKGEIEGVLRFAEEFNNFEDWPWPLIYSELYEYFPNAKFILTTRISSEKWFDSLCKHALRTGPTDARKQVYGSYMPHDFKNHYIQFYESHNREIRKFFSTKPEGTFLDVCWERNNGWDELAGFLGTRKPQKDFPRRNQSPKNSNYVFSKALKKLRRMK